MSEPIKIVVGNNKKKVRIYEDPWGIELHTMRNGWQWVGQNVDDELMELIIECIEKYKAKKQERLNNK